MSAKEVKRKRKAEREAAEAARKAEVDKMMKVYDSDGGDGASSNDGGGEEEEVKYDKFGNVVDGRAEAREAAQAARKAALEERAAQAARELRAAGVDAGIGASSRGDGVCNPDPNPIVGVDYGAKAEAEMEAVAAKARGGGKLTNKEKRLLKKYEEKVLLGQAEEARVSSGLSAFSLTLR
ncbi:unnamed protein product, partial [Discosporangium mesarthrocarpum]